MEALHVLHHTISNTFVTLVPVVIVLMIAISRAGQLMRYRRQREASHRVSISPRTERRQHIDIIYIEDPFDSKADTKEFMRAQDEETRKYIAGTLTIDLPEPD